MHPLIALSCCLLACVSALPLDGAAIDTSNVDVLKPSNNTKLVFGDVIKLTTTSYSIWYMALDKLVGSNNVLQSLGSALSTVSLPKEYTVEYNKVRRTPIAGSVDLTGLKNGQNADARFNMISSFYQLNRTQVVVVDQKNHCLRLVDRDDGVTSHYVGRCNDRGFADGDVNKAEFDNPSHVFIDERNGKALLLIDDINNALRSIDIATRQTTTLIQDDVSLHRPRFGTFDNEDKNVLYITVRFKVIKLSLSDKKITEIVGTVVRSGFADGSFSEALFSYRPATILQLDKNHLAVADYWNHNVRLINLVEQSVTSLCPHTKFSYSTSGIIDCSFQFPHGMMLLNGSLYVSDIANFHIIPVSSIPYDGKTAVKDVCGTKTITAFIEDGQTRATVNVGGGNVLELSAGSHRFMYQIKKTDCSVDIEVKNAELKRRVEFELDYKYDCAQLNNNNVASKLVSDRVKSNFATVIELCKDVCSREQGVDAAMVCENGTLTVTYPTDLSYGGDVFVIPKSVKQTLTDRLLAKGTMMSIVDTTRIPPSVFPEVQPDGSSAKLLLATYCLNQQKVYNPETDSCK